MRSAILAFGCALMLPAIQPAPVSAAPAFMDVGYYYHGHPYRYRWNGGYYNYRWHGHYYRSRYRCGGAGWCYR